MDAGLRRGSDSGSAVVHDEPVAHPDDPVAGGADVLVVGHDDEGQTAVAVQAPDEAEDVRCPGTIEVAGRFVADDELGSIDERAGDRDALLFTTGQLRRPMLRAIGQADQAEGVEGRGVCR
jgi:hypothetical protein